MSLSALKSFLRNKMCVECHHKLSRKFSQSFCLAFAKKKRENKLHSLNYSASPRNKVLADDAALENSLEELKTEISSKRKTQSYVFTRTVARRIANLVLKHRIKQTAPLLELQAGPGLVGEEFLKLNVSKVIALETKELFSPYLTVLQDRYGKEKYEYFSWPMLNRFLKLNTVLSNDVKSYLQTERAVVEKLGHAISDQDTPYSIFSVGGELKNEDFVFFILKNLPQSDPILAEGRVEFFFLIHPYFQKRFEYAASVQKSKLNYSYIHMILYLLYDIQFIGEFAHDDFWPPFTVKKTTQKMNIDSRKRVLMRMQLKNNVKDILPLAHHSFFFLFIRQILKIKRKRIIPTMEMLVPGCGLRMIAEGFTMMDVIGTIEPQKFLHLYKNARKKACQSYCHSRRIVKWGLSRSKSMVTWPEYSSSSLKSDMLMSLTGTEDDSGLHTQGTELEES